MSISTIQTVAGEKINNDQPKNIWKGIRQGENKSLSRLFRLYYQLLFDYGFKLVRDEDLIRDSIQELFLKLWEQHNKLDSAQSVKSYLLSSLRRMVLRNKQKQRARYHRNRKYIENSFEDIYNVEEVMIHFEIKRENRTDLTRALENLSRRQKEAIYLKFYDGLNNDEIAYVMDINKQSVYNYVAQAISKLQEFVN